MKILFFLGSPNPSPRASWTRIGFFADNWSRKGHSVEVLGTFSYKSLGRRGTKKCGKINIFNLIFSMRVDNPLTFILNSLVSFVVSITFLWVRKPNIVIISVPNRDAGIGAMIACKLLGTKYIVDYRDEWEDYALSRASSKVGKLFYSVVRKFTTILYAGSRVVATVTPNLKKTLIKRGLRNVTLLTNGADTRTFKPLNIKKNGEDFIIFYSGSIGGYYRLDIVVKALKRLIDKGLSNINLMIAGTGEIQKLLNLAEKLGLSNHIKYVGVINEKTKLASLMAMANSGIVPYDDNPLWKNSVSAKFYEYCACGLPVIATVHSNSYLQELIEKYKIGITSPPLDEEKLANAIHWLYRNKSFREAAGKRARQLTEEKFDRNKIAEEYLNLIKDVLH